MLYIFHGTDIASSAKKAHSLIDSLRAKRPDAAFVSITASDWNRSIIEEHLGGQGLFSNKYIVFLNRVTENVDAKENLASVAEVMNQSTNVFIVLEAKLNAELKKAFEKYAEKIVISEPKEVKSFFAKAGFNVFALGDAVAQKNSLKAWVLYRQAVASGIESEAIIGTLFWKMKTQPNPGESLRQLIQIYHDGHRGLLDIELSLERYILRLA